MAERFEFGAKFTVIIDLTVKDNAPLAGIFKNRLVPALQIDDLQSCGAARESFRGKRALLVWPAMMQRGHSFLDSALRCSATFMGEAGNPAQVLCLSENWMRTRSG